MHFILLCEHLNSENVSEITQKKVILKARQFLSFYIICNHIFQEQIHIHCLKILMYIDVLEMDLFVSPSTVHALPMEIQAEDGGLVLFVLYFRQKATTKRFSNSVISFFFLIFCIV